VGANTYRIPPIPLVTISEPALGQLTKGRTSILIRWSERYARWDGKRYTENYPCLDTNDSPCTSSNASPNPTQEWHDTAQIAFNLKYSPDGNNWYSMLTDSPARLGEYMDASDSIASNATYKYSYTWDVSGVTPNGTKTVRVECYRVKTGLHYSYHEIAFETGP
jgi:hypothetical protein